VSDTLSTSEVVSEASGFVAAQRTILLVNVVRIDLRVSPGAPRSAIAGRYGTGWKVRVTVAPEAGRANAELLRLLATVLDVPERSLSIAAGRQSRRKTVTVDGVDRAEVERRLDAASR
jgi:hypothetical protein